MSIDPRPARFARPSPAALIGFALVAAARLLTLPESLWEWDEILFVKGIESYDPLHHQPHPPGYPLLIGLGKLLNFFLNDPFVSLVTLNVVCSLIGYAALVSAFRRLAAGDRAAVIGALLFHLSPSMLVYGPLALSDSPALMFLSLALAAAARLPEGGVPAATALGVFASGAIGCRPQLALAVLPMTAVALVFARGLRPRLAALAAFTLTSLLWFVPLLVAVGGPDNFLPFLSKQAGLVAEFDTQHPRTGGSALWVATRFLSHPWGPRWTALPVLALAAAGFVALVRRRQVRALPLAVLAGIDLTLGLLVMNPFDAVRYALPSLLAVAFAAGVGCEALARRAPAAAWLAAALLVLGFCVYTAPLLTARSTTPSPPVQAMEWAKREARYDAVFLVEDNLAAHASYLLPFQRVPVAQGLQRYALERTAPVYLLGNGESGWPDARTFAWPDSDAYGKLSRGGLYRVVSISPLPLERRFDALRGVHAWEPTAREAGYRWMEDNAAIRLVPRRPRLRVRLRLHPSAPWPSNTVVIAVAGSPAATLEIPRGEERSVEVSLPRADTVDVTFRSVRSFVPAETAAGTDRRRLAVQLVEIEQVGP
ncbi:MAG TPA: hypothetical protein VMW27_31010 [Thermoanaerobaculia bacterium]|nr:hypothetical protein [Thermoanaerobaculia bacterium]